MPYRDPIWLLDVFLRRRLDGLPPDTWWREQVPTATHEEVLDWENSCHEIDAFIVQRLDNANSAGPGRLSIVQDIAAAFPQLDPRRALALVERARRPNLDLVVQPPFADLIPYCAGNCDIGCCGLDAIVVTVEPMRTWIRRAGATAALEARQQIESLAGPIEAHPGPVTSHHGFNDGWRNGAECAAYLRHWAHVLQEAISSGMENP